MLSSSYSLTLSTEIGKIQCIVHGFPQGPCSLSPISVEAALPSKGSQGPEQVRSPESSPRQWGFFQTWYSASLCSRSMADTRPLCALAAVLNCSFSMRVEHYLPLWSHPAGTSCILRFSSTIAFSEAWPENPASASSLLEHSWNCPVLFLISSSTQGWYDDVSDGHNLRTSPLPPFSLCIPALSLVLDLFLDLDRTCYRSEFHQRSLVPFQAAYAILFLYSSLTFQLFLPSFSLCSLQVLCYCKPNTFPE